MQCLFSLKQQASSSDLKTLCYLGGLSEQGDDNDKLTNPELRKARFDILYKEYEVFLCDLCFLGGAVLNVNLKATCSR